MPDTKFMQNAIGAPLQPSKATCDRLQSQVVQAYPPMLYADAIAKYLAKTLLRIMIIYSFPCAPLMRDTSSAATFT